MPYVGDYTVCFSFSRSDGLENTVDESFDPDIYNQIDVDTRADELLEELNDDCTDDDDGEPMEWEYDGYTITDFDTDYADPSDFSDLTDYSEYAQLVSKHGEAYALRYEDIGENDFESDYYGSYDDEEEFARTVYEEHYDIPAGIVCHIDWESVAREVLMDYSYYHGREGIHIFND